MRPHPFQNQPALQLRFDPEALYIKRWVPELRPFPAIQLHRLFKKPLSIDGYPPPSVDHKERSQMAKAMFSESSR